MRKLYKEECITSIDIKNKFINNFLKEIKKLVAKDDYTLADREKNLNFLKENGLTLDDVKETILSLSINDKAVGPEDDRNGYPGYVFKFKTAYLMDDLIYVKIRYNPPDEVVCISFHDDEIN